MDIWEEFFPSEIYYLLNKISPGFTFENRAPGKLIRTGGAPVIQRKEEKKWTITAELKRYRAL